MEEETSSVKTIMSYNLVRFNAYRRCATEFVNGDVYDMHELANMLHDLRWAEVPRAFSVALYNAARKGPLRRGLELEFKQLLAYVTFLAFGSTEREVVQPWFLKNWDDFFVSCVDGILCLNNRSDDVVKRRETIIRRTVGGVLTLIEGARRYMSLDRLAESSAVHALLVAAGHARGSFLWHGYVHIGGDQSDVPDMHTKGALRSMTLAHLFVMDVIAEAILATGDTEVVSWERAFGHYAGSLRWRAFAQRCKVYRSEASMLMPRALLLEHQVQEAYGNAVAIVGNSSKSTRQVLGKRIASHVPFKRKKRGAVVRGVVAAPRLRVVAPFTTAPPIMELEGTHGRPWDGARGGWGIEQTAALRCY